MCCLRRPTMRAAGLVGIAGGWAALVCGDPIWRVFLRLLLSDGLSRLLDQRWNLNFNFNFVWWFRRQEDYVSSKEKQQVVWPFLGTLYFWVQWIHCARSSSQRSIITHKVSYDPQYPSWGEQHSYPTIEKLGLIWGCCQFQLYMRVWRNCTELRWDVQ